MDIRRPIVVLVTALTLIGGGGLTACGDPTDSNTGTPKDTASNTSENVPTQDNSDPDTGSDNDGGSPAT